MERARRLLFLSESVGFGAERTPGGGELFAIEFLAEMVRRGWRISVAAPSYGPLFRNPALDGSVSWHALDLSIKISDPRFLIIVARWIFFSRRFRDATIYGNGYATLKWLALARLFWGARAFCHLHESEYGCYSSRRARVLSRFVPRFFAISDTVRDLFVAGAQVAANRVLRVHNGVPVAASPPQPDGEDRAAARLEVGAPASGAIVLMVARTNPLKGHEVLLRSIAEVRAKLPEVTFVILGLAAGSPEEKETYQHLQTIVEREGVHDVLRQMGFRADARRFMRCADVVVVPSTQEGFGRTAIEAMAENTAVIASAVGGLKEIITDGVDGWLFPPRDHAALADRIISVLRNPIAARVVAQRGYETARNKFSTERMTDLLESAVLDDTEVPKAR